jgi:hypothetical protein
MQDDEDFESYKKDLVTDIEDQMKLALSDQHYSKWGQPYLLSCANAHRKLWCNNFKDKSLQHYV